MKSKPIKLKKGEWLIEKKHGGKNTLCDLREGWNNCNCSLLPCMSCHEQQCQKRVPKDLIITTE